MSHKSYLRKFHSFIDMFIAFMEPTPLKIQPGGKSEIRVSLPPPKKKSGLEMFWEILRISSVKSSDISVVRDDGLMIYAAFDPKVYALCQMISWSGNIRYYKAHWGACIMKFK